MGQTKINCRLHGVSDLHLVPEMMPNILHIILHIFPEIFKIYYILYIQYDITLFSGLEIGWEKSRAGSSPAARTNP